MFKFYKAKSNKDFIKQREEKEGLKNIFFEKIDKNYMELSKEERLQHLIKILEKKGFKIKK